MDCTQTPFARVDADDQAGLARLLDDHPGLVHVRKMVPLHPPTLLSYAAKAGRLEICRLLVDRGAEVYPNPMAQYPPVMEAAWANHQPVVDYFLHEIPHLAEGTHGLGVMINLAARQGWADIVREHLARDPLSVHQRGWIGDTPLHWPSHNRHPDIVRMLLAAGADVEADEIFWSGGKPLHWASEHAPRCVEALLAAGAEVNSRNVMPGSQFEGVTPLIMNATQKDDCAEVAELLLAAGADPNATDAAGKTALAHATERGLVRIPEVLRRHGAG